MTRVASRLVSARRSVLAESIDFVAVGLAQISAKERNDDAEIWTVR